MDRMFALAAVPLIIWIGVFIYMLMIDRKLARLEALSSTAEEDEL